MKGTGLVFIVVLFAIALQFPSTLHPSFNAMYKLIDWAQGTVPDQNWALSGNFGPVKEEVFAVDIPITTGQFPADLDGLFVRIGPNPNQPENGNYHWFDGDGMLHAVRFKDGKVNYTNKFMETNRLSDERSTKRNIYPRIGSMRGITGILRLILFKIQLWLGVLDNHEQFTTSTANTATLYHHGHLFALNEASLPFDVLVGVDGKIYSKGYDLREWNYPFTAHPKVDPETGNLIFFGYSMLSRPYVRYGISDKNGKILNTLDINNISEPIMMHDFAITKHYSIVMDLPLIFRPENMISGGFSFIFNKNRGSRFGIFPHSASSESEIRWFPAEGCFIFHTCNAWEEGDVVVLLANRFEYFDLDFVGGITSKEQLWEFRFDMKTGKTTERRVFEGNWEFPQIHPDFVGRKNRFAYFSIINNKTFPGMTKADLEKNVFSEFLFGGKKSGGEAVFVPKKKPVTEDDGYLLLIVHDEESGISSFCVMDAVKLEPLATVELPQRVPYGFHAGYLSEEQLKEMNGIK